ncbi:helix-turn-helix transcriptional regulator [Paenibacillus taiwanensis]|uniref:helix-turn-helix transcriptional regulator n=1 Tax=Paenibacillus taiwanensis TaxID=401638 RepID=UPI00042735EF|nr:helix-turn-helix transcriptional regulator [Paenibacillus taiwanensis]
MNLQLDSWDLDGMFGEFHNVTPSSPLQEQHHYLYNFPSHSGTGNLHRIRLRDGLEINWFDAILDDPVTMDVGIHYPHLEIAYTMSGKGCWQTSAQAQDFEICSGVSTLVYMNETKMHAEFSQSEPLLHMELRIDLRHLQAVIPEMDRLSTRTFYCKQTVASPQIPFIVEQMKQCPYKGALQRLYLEGKALELLAFHLDGIDHEAKEQQVKSKLTADDIQCLYQARDILSRSWRQPPSLLGLARLAGLNDYKLKLGFKELFGTTVFGYVRGLRMHEARSILEQGHANVSETAMMVGYNNMSHFAALFRKTFGYNPSDTVKLGSATTGTDTKRQDLIHFDPY